MSEARLNQIESMLAAVIQTAGTLKACFEEEREENGARYRETQRIFEQLTSASSVPTKDSTK